MKVTLPEKFANRIKEQLGSEYEDYLNCFESNYRSGLRVNTLKSTPEHFKEIFKFEIDRIPWIKNGYFCPENETLSKHPFYYGGLYYLQEPSAMTPASLLPVKPGDKVLDVCAAPGGKSTELAARLCGEGVLISNDISNSRAKALLKNLELFGVKNSVIVSEPPAKLTERFTGYFDCILVDAPCSGEGMFRKSPAIMKNWEQYGTEYYRDLQRQILPEAVAMLKAGGYLLYSTCTFSPMENEETVQFLLDRYPELEIVPAIPNDTNGLSYEGFDFGHPEWTDHGDETLRYTLRLWPHRIAGEGHYVALLHKKDAEVGVGFVAEKYKKASLPSEAEEFLNRIGFKIPKERLVIREDKVYLLPEGLPDMKGLRILRSGLLLGEIHKNRFEPSQALANALKSEEFDNCYHLEPEDPDVIKYLKCESIEAKTEVKDGYVLVCAGDYPLGWAKANRGSLKNKYLPGWRMM